MSVNKAQYESVLEAIRSLSKNHIKPLFTQIGGVLVNDFRMGFRRSRAPDGSPWAGISHRAGQPLRDTGRLRNSITFDVDNNTLEIGTNVEYAATQHFGLTEQVQVPAHTRTINQAFGRPLPFPVNVNVRAHTKKQGIKARPFLGIERRQQRKIVKTYQDYITDITGGEAQQL